MITIVQTVVKFYLLKTLVKKLEISSSCIFMIFHLMLNFNLKKLKNI